MPNRLRLPTARAVAAFMLLGYVVGTLPVPLPMIGPVAGGTPFPCQSHGCGCRSAAQCWQSCCCFSREEKLAWAREQHQPVADELLTDRDEAGGLTREPGSCCDSSRKLGPRDEARGQASPDHVVVLRALRCRGLGAAWIGLADPGALPPRRVVWQRDHRSGRIHDPGPSLASALPQQPPVPPG